MNEIESENINWYNLSYRFYSNNEIEGKDALQWFQNLINNLNNNNEVLHPDKELLYRKCGIFIINSEERWYELDKIRNKARNDAHNHGTKNRIYETINTCYIISSNNQLNISYSIIKKLIQKLIISTKNDYSLWTTLDHITYWIIRQLQFTTCSKISIECSSFTERQYEISHQLITFLSSIGQFILPPGISSDSLTVSNVMLEEGITDLSSLKLCWIMKKEISNDFLLILLKLLEKKRQHVYTDQRNLFIEQTDIERENTEGMNDRAYVSTASWCQWRFCFCCL